MCGRYGVRVNFGTLAKLLRAEPVDLPEPVEWGPDYNIAPTDLAPVLVPGGVRDGRDPAGPVELALFRWGLLPFWAKSAREGAKMVNARSESAAEKPAFREALAERRLLVPASGWYEWTKAAPDDADARPDPHWITPASVDGGPGGAELSLGPRSATLASELALFGGLWSAWRDPESGEKRHTFTIVTTPAADSTRVLHERMPLVLAPAEAARWVDPTTSLEAVRALMKPYDGPIRHQRVKKLVNNVRADGPELIEPLAEPRQARLL